MKNGLLGMSFLFFSFTVSFSQKDPMVFNTTELVWCGLDYSYARFIGSRHFNAQELPGLFVAWNDLMLSESDKYNFREAYQKKIQINDLSVATARNAKVNPEERLIDELYSLPTEELHNIIAEYDLRIEEGLGLVYIVEALNKKMQSASVYVVFFDIAKREILWALKYKSGAQGFGMRNYWARPVYEIIKSSQSTYKRASKKRKGNHGGKICTSPRTVSKVGSKRSARSDSQCFKWLQHLTHQKPVLLLRSALPSP